MKFIEIITTFFLPVHVSIISSFSVYRQSYISNKTGIQLFNKVSSFISFIIEYTSIFNKGYYRRKRDIQYSPSPSWKFSIKYYIQPPVNENNVKKAIEIISNNTCVNFTESSSSFNNEEGLIYKKDSSCASFVGKIRKTRPQEIFLTERCYNSVPHILHEIGHALGLKHEHSRSDRNKYVEVDYENVKKTEYANFNRSNEKHFKNFSTSYDFHSLMHYKPKDFAINNTKVVLSSKTYDPYNRMMGQRVKMTFNDFKQINLRHCDKCKWFGTDGERNKSYSNVNCTNGGYPDYNNCSRCICPTGYTGDDCKNIVASDKSYGNTSFHAQPYPQNLFFDDIKTCYIFLLAERGKKIKINVTYSNTHFKLTCTEEVSNQIKYRRDKGNTGLLLCGWYFDNVIVTSESNSVLVIFRGAFKSSGIFFTFKEHTKKIKHSKTKRSKYKK